MPLSYPPPFLTGFGRIRKLALVRNGEGSVPPSPPRGAATASERLCLCLRYLVTGDAQVTIAASYRMSAAVVGRIINDTCEVLWSTLIEKGYLKNPSTPEEWKSISKDFDEDIGAIDGKHVLMQAPANSGSAYFNYKKTFSIVLMAVCNAKHQFTLVDIGDIGRQRDGSVYGSSYFFYY